MPTMLQDLSRTLTTLSPTAVRGAITYRHRKAMAEAAWTPKGKPRRGLPRLSALLRSLVGRHTPWPDRWIHPGSVQMIRPTERGAVAETAHGAVEITLFAPDLVRVRYLPTPNGRHPAPEPLPYAVAKPLSAWSVPAFETIQQKEAYFLVTAKMIIGLRLATAQLFFADPAGRLLRADVDVAHGRTADAGPVRHRTALAKGERLYGLGEKATSWDRRGRTHVMWNADPAGYADGDDPINLNIPVYLGVVPTSAGAETYLTFYENPYYGEFDMAGSAPNVADHRFLDGELRYYFATGSPPDLMTRYTELTGRHAMQPLWMLGYQQSRWSYDSEERVRKLARDFAQHQVPCDAVHIDIDYMDGYRCFTWDADRFPTPAEMASDLRQQGIKLVTIIDPGIKRDPNYRVYREGKAAGHFCTMPDGEIFHAPVWPGDSAFPDFTDPEARAWWGQLYKPLLDTGIAGFWNDMNEPAAFAQRGDSTLPQTLRHSMEGRGGNHREAHNVYGMLMVRATRQGLAALRPEKRSVVITRAGWAGVQRYATSWTADNESTWEALRLTMPMVMGLGLSGLGFTGPDVGGFIGTPSGELFTRWIQMAAFMPFFRAHTALNYPDQEPWSYGEPYLSIVRRFIELRYELLPYLYTALWQMTARGWPMVRPLAWADPTAVALWDVDDAFLCGDSLLIAPILEAGAEKRNVVLPPGTWYEFWTHQALRGGHVADAFAPLESMPLYVREGTVLTMGEIGASVEQRKDKFLRLGVYPLSAPGQAVSELYEDAGEGMDYLEGDQRLSRFVMERDGETLSIDWLREGAYTPPYEHIELTINGLRRAPRAIEVDGEAYNVVTADPVRRTVLLGIPLFDRLRIAL
ncbi:MAG: TIM-barrel domain-containing protein [Anaerolineae bacterium]